MFAGFQANQLLRHSCVAIGRQASRDYRQGLSGKCSFAKVAHYPYDYSYQDEEQAQGTSVSTANSSASTYDGWLAESYPVPTVYYQEPQLQQPQPQPQPIHSVYNNPLYFTPTLSDPTYQATELPLLPSQLPARSPKRSASQRQTPPRDQWISTTHLQQQQGSSRKRQRTEDFTQENDPSGPPSVALLAVPQYSTASYQAGDFRYHSEPCAQLESQSARHVSEPVSEPTQQHSFLQHHHHRLPTQQPGYGQPIGDNISPTTAHDSESTSVVGQPGMPEPAPRPKGPKLKFTPEDDALLIELKETKNLTWKQIADFLPGRSSGTLQVRYCTKLKPKTAAAWTDEMVQRLRTAVQEYEDERWRIIASKVGNGFTAAACMDKVEELEAEQMRQNMPDDEEYLR